MENNNENIKNRIKALNKDLTDKYNAELDRLKLFVEKWNAYVNDIVEENPSNKTRKAVMIGNMLKEILSKADTPNYGCREKIIEMYSIIGEVKPQKKSLYGEGENGFNMDDVLNPKEELNLGDLLKELGVK